MWIPVIIVIVWGLYKAVESNRRESEREQWSQQYISDWGAAGRPMPFYRDKYIQNIKEEAERQFNANSAAVAQCPQPVCSAGSGRVYSRDEYDYAGYLVEKAEQQERMTRASVKTPVQSVCRAKVKVPEWFIDVWVQKLSVSPAEQLIINELVKYNIRWEREVSFVAMSLTDKGARYRYDFLLVDYGIIIEYDSQMWHSDPERLAIDSIKNKFCRDYHIEVIRYNKKHYYRMESEIEILMDRLGVNLAATC